MSASVNDKYRASCEISRTGVGNFFGVFESRYLIVNPENASFHAVGSMLAFPRIAMMLGAMRRGFYEHNRQGSR